WSSQCGVQFSYVGLAAQKATVYDGASVIGWVPSFERLANTSWYVRAGLMAEADIQLNAGGLASPAATYPMVLHELGHAIGLDHSEVSGSVMAGPPAAEYSYSATLAADDIAACQSLYGASTGPVAAQTPPVAQ